MPKLHLRFVADTSRRDLRAEFSGGRTEMDSDVLMTGRVESERSLAVDDEHVHRRERDGEA